MKRFPLFAALAALVVSLFAVALALAVREVVVGDALAVDLGAPGESEDGCGLGESDPDDDAVSLPVRVPLERSPVPKLRAVPARDSGRSRRRGGPELPEKRVRRS